MSALVLPDLSRARRLLVLRLSSIGDVVHALPVSAALGEAFPQLEITWIVEEMSAPMVLGNPYLHDVIVIPRSRWKSGRLRSPVIWREYIAFLRNLRKRQFDVTLDLHGFAKTGILALATGAPHRLGWWRLREGANLVSRSLPRRPESRHRVDWFLDVVRLLGAEPAEVRFPFTIPEEARVRVRELLHQHRLQPLRYVVMNPAGGDPARRWGVRQYAELAAHIARIYGLPTVLIGSSREQPACDKVIQLAQEEFRGNLSHLQVISMAGKTDLKELAALLEMSLLQVCGDTGSTHIGAALGRPVIGLYGPTDPCHAGPWGQESLVLSRHDMCISECHRNPCALTRETTGSRGKPVPRAFLGEAPDLPLTCCLRAISVDEVLGNVERVLHVGDYG